MPLVSAVKPTLSLSSSRFLEAGFLAVPAYPLGRRPGTSHRVPCLEKKSKMRDEEMKEREKEAFGITIKTRIRLCRLYI